jgi:hypothetical protein
MFIACPGITGDAEQVKTHIKRNSPCDGGKGALAVGKVTGVLPKEVPDKRLSQCFVSSVLHKEMLQFTSHPSQIKGPIRQFHPFKVDDDNPEPVPEKYIGRRDIAVYKDLLVFPHKAPLSPPVLEPVKLLGFIRSYVLTLSQLFHNVIKIRTIHAKVHSDAISRAVVQGGQKIGKGSKLLEKRFFGPPLYCIDNEIVERCPVAELQHQKEAQVGIAT